MNYNHYLDLAINIGEYKWNMIQKLNFINKQYLLNYEKSFEI